MKFFHKIIILYCVVLFSGLQNSLSAQLFTSQADETEKEVKTEEKHDSIYIALLLDSLENSRLLEANTRMELEQLRFHMLSADSMKREWK